MKCGIPLEPSRCIGLFLLNFRCEVFSIAWRIKWECRRKQVAIE
jgi:hypothetical protein